MIRDIDLLNPISSKNLVFLICGGCTAGLEGWWGKLTFID